MIAKAVSGGVLVVLASVALTPTAPAFVPPKVCVRNLDIQIPCEPYSGGTEMSTPVTYSSAQVEGCDPSCYCYVEYGPSIYGCEFR